MVDGTKLANIEQIVRNGVVTGATRCADLSVD